MTKKTNPNGIYKDLINNIKGKKGKIIFNFAGIEFNINSTDTVGKSLQEWLKEYLRSQDYYFTEPENTQAFPDFFLSEDRTIDLLEIKSFHYSATPAFDIANFDSYCAKIEEDPFCLYADYLVFGYEMDDGVISIEDIWLKKIWEIAGSSTRYPLKTQIKKDVIYNIRPNSGFKYGRETEFTDEKSFLKALYETIEMYRGESFAKDWKSNFCENYKEHYEEDIEF